MILKLTAETRTPNMVLYTVIQYIKNYFHNSYFKYFKENIVLCYFLSKW